MAFDRNVLKIDPAQELDKLSRFIREELKVVFRRKGIVVGLSGGIDSACIAAVAVHTIGKDKVIWGTDWPAAGVEKRMPSERKPRAPNFNLRIL